MANDPLGYLGRKAKSDRAGIIRIATNDEVTAGTRDDLAVTPKAIKDISAPDGTTTVKGIVRLATVAETQAGTSEAIANTPAGLAAVAIAGAPNATTGGRGIIELATDAEAVALADTERAVVPSALSAVLASPGNIGGTTPGNGIFVDLNADATGDIALDADAASHFAVAGAGVDLTLESAAGRVIVNGEEAADNAVTILSAAGGLDVDVAKQLALTSSENTADSIKVESSAGGIDILASGAAAGEDIDIAATGSSVNISSSENVADSITITSSAGGIDVTAAGAAGEDIDITCTAGSVNITGGENAGDSVVITSSAGGIDILASGASAGEDIDITATGSSVNIISTEADADAIVIDASDAAGGINVDCGTGGIAIDSTGAVSVAGAAASDITVGGAGNDLTLESTLGRVIVNAEEAADNAITLLSAAGGMDCDCALQLSLVSSEVAADAIEINASGGGVDITAATNDIDITASTAGVNVTSSEAAATAITLSASDAAGGITLDVGTGDLNVTGGDLNMGSVATTLSLNGGAVTDFIGQATLVNGEVIVANTNIAATDRIFVTRSAINASTALGHFLTTISAGASFKIEAKDAANPANDVAGDLSTVDYFIVKQT